MVIVLKSGSLNLLEPSGPVQACNWIALPLNVTAEPIPTFYFLSSRPTFYNLNDKPHTVIVSICDICCPSQSKYGRSCSTVTGCIHLALFSLPFHTVPLKSVVVLLSLCKHVYIHDRFVTIQLLLRRGILVVFDFIEINTSQIHYMYFYVSQRRVSATSKQPF